MKEILLDTWLIASVVLFITVSWLMYLLPIFLWNCFFLSEIFLGLSINVLLSLNIILYKESDKKLGGKV